MRKLSSLLVLALMSVHTYAHLNFIDISKISTDKKLVTAFHFLKEHEKYYNHWTNVWEHDKPKEDLIKQLREHMKSFSALVQKNEETYLLLGDIAHYLYNMDDTVCYGIAIENYRSAVKAKPNDYRAYWFLGHHYSLSNVPASAIDNFRKAEKLLPQKEADDFWSDYAWAALLANMPSHCIYAIDKVKNHSSTEGSFQQQLTEMSHKKIVPVDKSKSYKKEDIWTVSQGDKITFTSRPLGLKIRLDSTWDVQIYDYQKNQTAFVITPPAIANKKGKEIHYSVAILMKTANDNDQLSDYVNNFVSKYTIKKLLSFSDKYDKMIAYEIYDNTMYQDIGGGHLYLVGIEREAPKYPGLLLENPMEIPKGNSNEVGYYTTPDSKNRFIGKIFYAIMLDSCEDINIQSLAVFKALFNNEMFIE